MKTLRERLAELFLVVESSEGGGDPGYDIFFRDYVSFGFLTEAEAGAALTRCLDALEKVVQEYLHVAFDDPPMDENSIGSLEREAAEAPDTEECIYHATTLRPLFQMIRWQQTVIHRLSRDNGYQEGFEAGRVEGLRKDGADLVKVLGVMSEKFRMF